LKKLVFFAVILVSVWTYREKVTGHRASTASDHPIQIRESNQRDQRVPPKSETQAIDRPSALRIDDQFKCDGRVYCSQMTSRAEAEFFLKNCPNTKMDGDRDGIPCENDDRF
jgi:hypothetical protein